LDENNIREFTKSIGQHEQTWKPAREELATIDVGNDKIKKKIKDMDCDHS
jgi:septal ring factor EnvC (AmiA/AmiB activator)